MKVQKKQGNIWIDRGERIFEMEKISLDITIDDLVKNVPHVSSS
jgi:hypothetical protein